MSFRLGKGTTASFQLKGGQSTTPHEEVGCHLHIMKLHPPRLNVERERERQR